MSECPICKIETELIKHHIKSRCYGGTNKGSNIINICSNCHLSIHKGDIVIEGKFMIAPIGLTIVYRNKGEASITGVSDPKVFIY